MSFNSLVYSRLQDDVTRSAIAFAGITGDGGVCALLPDTPVGGSAANLDARGEDRFAESTRVAREHYDTLPQGFFTLPVPPHAAGDHLPADSAAKPRLSNILPVMGRALKGWRCTIDGPRSPHERRASLGEALAGVPHDLGLPSAGGIRVVVRGRERELRAGLRDEVYRIGREAIVNACRHSRATEIETEVEYRATGLRIAVRDNGCGIDPQQLRWGRPGHWGL